MARAELFPSVCCQLTLTKIRDSEEEMKYITKMRNIIINQVGNREEYRYLKHNSFKHVLLSLRERRNCLEMCLRYALLKIMRSFVSMESYRPFFRYPIMGINNDGFLEPNGNQEPEFVRSIHQQQRAELYIVTTFKSAKCYSFVNSWDSWDLLQQQLMYYSELNNFQLHADEAWEGEHNSIWRRVFANNYSYFYSSDTNVDAYVKEQTRTRRPIRVLHEVLGRQRGGAINQLGILENIASPYYYVLPDQIERNNERMQMLIQHFLNERVIDQSRADEALYCFKSCLTVGRKNA
ncbi:uncharacterized protein TNCT_462581 [Trichonephila clavata]|uniref:Helitron helicase-like domain-containing protein n=1 Tax=Trichonephila clavata TaxID=2740835 RepID=A0A8X6GD81_TRICU|nr:uncharacterized protein TNCT_462581 [Trichonephila clavata]